MAIPSQVPSFLTDGLSVPEYWWSPLDHNHNHHHCHPPHCQNKLVCYCSSDCKCVVTFLVFGGCDMCGACCCFVDWGVRGLGGQSEQRSWIFNFRCSPAFLFSNIDILIIIQLTSCLIGLGSILMHAIEHTITVSNYRHWILLIASIV